ncbi:MAG: FAD-dependent oxidoreductase [Pseudomonadota bacterium]
MKHLLLLGGGPAHVQVLRSLARTGLATAHVTLVAPFPRPACAAMLAGFVAGHHGVDEGSIALPDLANAANVQFVQAKPSGVNASERTVTLADGRVMSYDALSLDAGPSLNRDAIPGARGLALFARPIEHFAKMWGGLLLLASERTLSVVVLGGGVLAVELAMALQYRLGAQARVSLVTGGTALLAGEPEPLCQEARSVLKRLAVTVIEDACTEVTATHVILRGGGRLVCDAPIAAWAPDGPPWLASSGLALDEQGFVLTGPTLQSSSHQTVFAVGDLASRADLPPGHGRDAHHAAPALSANLRRHVSTGELVRHMPRRRSLRFVTCGEKQALASWGNWAVTGPWVWRFKRWLETRQAARATA